MTPRGVVPAWRPREPPLAPVAVLARGGAAAGLVAATVARLDAGAVLRVTAGPSWLLVLGAAADLPWAEGVTYLGDDDGLLVPTTLVNDVPADVLRAALARRVPPEHALLALVGDDVLSSPRPVRAADAAAVLASAR